MKKCFSAILIISILMSAFSMGALAEGNVFELSMIGATSVNANVTVKNVSQSQADALVYVAAYDARGAFMGVVCQDISLDAGASTTVSGALSVNKAYELKAFVWSGLCNIQSDVIYKTIAPDGGIEDGGEI